MNNYFHKKAQIDAVHIGQELYDEQQKAKREALKKTETKTTRFKQVKKKIPGQDFYNLLVEQGFIEPEKAAHELELRKKVVDPKELEDQLF